MESYGFELTEPSEEDQFLYERLESVAKSCDYFFLPPPPPRYAKLHKSMCAPSCGMPELTSDLVNQGLAQWEPSYDYGTDSVFSIKPPKVPREDEIIYEDSVSVAMRGPFPIPVASVELYKTYAKQLYSI